MRQGAVGEHVQAQKSDDAEPKLSKRQATDAKRKKSSVQLSNLNKAAREEGMSHGRYMAAQRMAREPEE